MPTLHIRSVPEDLYARVSQLAHSRGGSLSAQVVTMLYQALDDEERLHLQGRTLEAIRRRRFEPPEGVPVSTDLLGEDRQR